jgi:heat-inducible transcriptional repressor
MVLQIPISSRKQHLLLLLTEEFIRTAAPVSSSSLTRFQNVSSATIRNELKELEELGFLKRPHTAAGCVPTSAAYRLYVDSLLSNITVDTAEVRALAKTFNLLSSEISKLVTKSLDQLVSSSGYMAFVTMPPSAPYVVRSINLIETDANQIMIVLVTDLGVMQSESIRTDVPARKLMLGHLNERLTNLLRGRNLATVRQEEIREALEDFAALPVSIQTKLERFLSDIKPISSRIVFSDAYRLLTQPEFYKLEHFRTMLDSVMDEESFLKKLEERRGVDLGAIIGDEFGKDELNEVSILFSNYRIGGSSEGRVGVVGPTRLYYSKTLPLVLNVARAISRVIDQWRKDSDES